MISFVLPSDTNLEERGRYCNLEVIQFLQNKELTESRIGKANRTEDFTTTYLASPKSSTQFSFKKKKLKTKNPTRLNMQHSRVGVLSIKQRKNMI